MLLLSIIPTLSFFLIVKEDSPFLSGSPSPLPTLYTYHCLKPIVQCIRKVDFDGSVIMFAIMHAP